MQCKSFLYCTRQFVRTPEWRWSQHAQDPRSTPPWGSVEQPAQGVSGATITLMIALLEAETVWAVASRTVVKLNELLTWVHNGRARVCQGRRGGDLAQLIRITADPLHNNEQLIESVIHGQPITSLLHPPPSTLRIVVNFTDKHNINSE